MWQWINTRWRVFTGSLYTIHTTDSSFCHPSTLQGWAWLLLRQRLTGFLRLVFSLSLSLHGEKSNPYTHGKQIDATTIRTKQTKKKTEKKQARTQTDRHAGKQARRHAGTQTKKNNTQIHKPYVYKQTNKQIDTRSSQCQQKKTHDDDARGSKPTSTDAPVESQFVYEEYIMPVLSQ